jgi:hypothetical protein
MFSVIVLWVLLISIVVAALHQAITAFRYERLNTGDVVFAPVLIAFAVFGMVRIWPWSVRTLHGLGLG